MSLTAGIGGTLGATGAASIAVPVPPDPGVRGLEVLPSGVVLDPTGPLGIGCGLTPLRGSADGLTPHNEQIGASPAADE